MNFCEQMVRILERINSLEKMYEQLNTYLMGNINLFWTVLFGIVGIVSLSLIFLVKSLVNAGIEKGVKKYADELSNQEALIQEQSKEIEKLKHDVQNYIKQTYSATVFELPLCKNIQGHLEYYRIGSLVYVYGNVKIDESDKDAFTHHIDISVLPYGFRPFFPLYQNVLDKKLGYSIYINQEGRVTLFPNSDASFLCNKTIVPILLSFPVISVCETHHTCKM